MKKLVSALLTICLLAAFLPFRAEAETYLTKGELCKQIVDNLELEYDESMTIPFTDVPEDSEYYQAVCILYSCGVVVQSGGAFCPNNKITRSITAVWLHRTGIPDGVPDTVPSDIRESFSYYDAACAVVKYGVMSVYDDGKFLGNQYAVEGDINWEAYDVDGWLNPNTTGIASLDICDGSITVFKNIKGLTVFSQGEKSKRSETAKAVVRQSNTGTAIANTITVKTDASLSIANLNISSNDSIKVYTNCHLSLGLINDNTISNISVLSEASLTISGSGSLTAKGIEGNCESSEISIVNGTVTATGGSYGTGIKGDKIYISGGEVTATGYRGIDGSEIYISGGKVTATGSQGAGIGNNNYGGIVTITGGEITATSTNGCAGIGVGHGSSGGAITINGGIVNAESYTSAGIGGIGNGRGVTVVIKNATVSVRGYENAIGGCENSNDYGLDSITIIDSEMTYSLSHGYNGGYNCRERIYYSGTVTDSAALSGKSAEFYTEASGASGVSYQWQQSADNSKWTDVEGQTDASAKIPMSAENDGYYYRCKITNGWDNAVYTDPAQAFVLAFTKQPQSTEVELEDYASLSVESSCTNVTYQWYRSYDEGKTWTKVEGEIYATLLVSATLSENDALYRCVITATNGDTLASDAARITVKSDAVTFTTNYYLEKADGTGYEFADRIITESETGKTVTAIAKMFNYFTENTSKGILSGTVLADGSLTLSRYYDRNKYSISFQVNGGSVLSDLTLRYGETIELPTPVRYAYVFEGWYSDSSLSNAFTEKVMPGNNLTLYAKWTPVDSDRGIEYKINGISLVDSSYNALKTIPQGQFFAEVSVTNTASNTADTLLLAAYDENGKMLGTYFLSASVPVGCTFMLGVSIDNSDGQIAKLKAFMLPMLGGVVPLAEAVEYTR